jgi:type II secretory ATPase GspE/PulE/Tfp pilus assembly ATPase PilB-like protein
MEQAFGGEEDGMEDDGKRIPSASVAPRSIAATHALLGGFVGGGMHSATPVMELTRVGEEIASLVSKRAPGSELRKAALRGGIVPLREAAAALVVGGATTLEEALRQTF